MGTVTSSSQHGGPRVDDQPTPMMLTGGMNLLNQLSLMRKTSPLLCLQERVSTASRLRSPFLPPVQQYEGQGRNLTGAVFGVICTLYSSVATIPLCCRTVSFARIYFDQNL